MIPTTQSRKPLFFWLATVLVVSVLPPSAFRAPVIDHIDLLAHALLYAITGALFFVELRSMPRFARSARSARSDWHTSVLGVLAASAYGLLMEVIQNYVPQREFSLLDAAANAVGACIGVWLVWMRMRQVQRKRQADGKAVGRASVHAAPKKKKRRR